MDESITTLDIAEVMVRELIDDIKLPGWNIYNIAKTPDRFVVEKRVDVTGEDAYEGYTTGEIIIYSWKQPEGGVVIDAEGWARRFTYEGEVEEATTEDKQVYGATGMLVDFKDPEGHERFSRIIVQLAKEIDVATKLERWGD